MPSRTCAAEGCAAKFKGHGNQKYHSKTCKDREAKRRWRESKRSEVIDPKRVRRGDPYATLEDAPALVEALQAKEISQRAAAAAIGVSESMFSEAWATFLADRSKAAQADEWEMADDLKRILAVEGYDYDPESQTLDEWLNEAVKGFAKFRHRFFYTPLGKRYITKKFHRQWIRAVLKAIITGSRQLILSPPRHGKSELLVHFCVWLITRNPNFRIVWVGGNSDIAEDMATLVKDELESNTDLIEAALPPGVTWAPVGRNKTRWGVKKFTVANRTIRGVAPTMRAVGRGGKILSMSADLLIGDDIEDFDSTENETTRGKTRNWWFNTVESRKEEHTAWLCIGSRQHPDDLYDYLLDDPEWDAIVDSAHDVDCGIDPGNLSAHVSCMLFPEIRSYRWLASKRRSAESQGLIANWEMVYLNDPRPAGLTVFDAESLERAKNPTRGFGLEGMKADVRERLDLEPHQMVGYHLVAGLDPSATGFQAAILWAWVKELNRLYVIDASNRKGGGIYPAWDLMREWLDAYALRHWLYEDNGFQAELGENRELKEWLRDNDVYLEPHNTQGGNRNNPLYGVGAMSKMYEADQIDLPWGSERARDIMRILIRQMVRFVENSTVMRRTSRKTDLLMASWFPMKAVRRFRKEVQAEASMEHESDYDWYSETDYDEVPW